MSRVAGLLCTSAMHERGCWLPVGWALLCKHVWVVIHHQFFVSFSSFAVLAELRRVDSCTGVVSNRVLCDLMAEVGLGWELVCRIVFHLFLQRSLC